MTSFRKSVKALKEAGLADSGNFRNYVRASRWTNECIFIHSQNIIKRHQMNMNFQKIMLTLMLRDLPSVTRRPVLQIREAPRSSLCLKCNNVNCLSNCLKSSCKCTNSGENHSAAHKGCPSFKLAISKLLDRQ